MVAMEHMGLWPMLMHGAKLYRIGLAKNSSIRSLESIKELKKTKRSNKSTKIYLKNPYEGKNHGGSGSSTIFKENTTNCNVFLSFMYIVF